MECVVCAVPVVGIVGEEKWPLLLIFQNVLEDLLRTGNSSLVLAILKLLLKFTSNMPDIYDQVFDRCKDPLLTMAANGPSEVTFGVLAHIKLLCQRNPRVFQPHFRSFFTKLWQCFAFHYLFIIIVHFAPSYGVA